MKLHTKKLIAPIVITIIISVYLMFFLAACLLADETPLGVKIFGSVIPLTMLGVVIYVLIERIKEIKGGEEDDLSKY